MLPVSRSLLLSPECVLLSSNSFAAKETRRCASVPTNDASSLVFTSSTTTDEERELKASRDSTPQIRFASLAGECLLGEIPYRFVRYRFVHKDIETKQIHTGHYSLDSHLGSPILCLQYKSESASSNYLRRFIKL